MWHTYLTIYFCRLGQIVGSRNPSACCPSFCFKRDGKQGCKTYANLSNGLCGIPPHSRTDFPGDFTPEGRDSLLPVGIPYTLFLEQFPSPVERIYAQEPVLALEEESGKTVRYRYTGETEFYLERRLEEVSPVVQKSFTGTITLKKTGFLKWKMEAFTAG